MKARFTASVQTALLLLTALAVRRAQASALETRVSERQYYNEASCTNVRIPPLLCVRCRLRPFNAEGKFDVEYGKDIYDFQKPECMEQLKEYVRVNPCDTVRSSNLPLINESTFAYKRIAQFAYSVCEQCCDMVTAGSKPGEWAARKESGTLHKFTRGNGPSHMHYDICKLFPNATRFIRPGWKDREGLSPMCPEAAEWMASPNSKGWAGNPDAKGISKRLQFAMRQMSKVFSCTQRGVWQDCVRMESAQGRIWADRLLGFERLDAPWGLVLLWLTFRRVWNIVISSNAFNIWVLCRLYD